MARTANGVALLLAAFVLLGAVYSLATPLFEAPDEFWHYAYVRHLALGGGLPVQRAGALVAHQEGTQPPLSYGLAALAVRLSGVALDPAVGEGFFRPNPVARIGPGELAPGPNKNAVLHSADEALPRCGGDCLAARLARLVSLAFGCLAVLGTYLLGRAVVPARPRLALAAAAAGALTPQLLFVSGAVGNDAAVAALGTLSLWALVRTTRSPTAGARDFLALGALLGLAALAKSSALLLLALALAQVAALALAGSAGRRRCLVGGALLLAAWSAVAGWWYVRNLLLYGEPSGLRMMLSIQGVRAEAVDPLSLVLAEGGQVWLSWWAQFGWSNVAAPAWAYAVYALLSLASLTGWVLLAARPDRRAAALGSTVGLGLLVLAVGLALAALLAWTASTYAAYGRLLYPAFGAIPLLLCLGWAALPLRRAVALAVAALGLLAAAMPAVIAGAY